MPLTKKDLTTLTRVCALCERVVLTRDFTGENKFCDRCYDGSGLSAAEHLEVIRKKLAK